MFDLDDLYDRDYMQLKLYHDNKISYEYLDFGKNQFYTAAEAWLEYRKDKNFINKTYINSKTAPAEDLLRYLFLDFHAIMNYEVSYKFVTFAFNKPIEKLSKAELAQIDHLAQLMLDIDNNFEEIKQLFCNTAKYRMLQSPLVDKEYFDVLFRTGRAKNKD